MSDKIDIQSIISVFEKLKLDDKPFMSLHEPEFKGNEWKYIKECIDTGWVSSVGSYVDKFERQLAEYTGVKRAVAVMNGTSALHICLKLCGVSPGDEVLIPALTFIATANAVTYCGATPHLVDCHFDTLGIDVPKLEQYLSETTEIKSGKLINKITGARIKAIVPMHTFGHPVDLDHLMEVCLKYKLVLIEDAAESLGSFYKGKHTGNWGECSALSFNGNKIVTTGGGGAILTNDEELAAMAKHITTTAKIPHKWEFKHDKIGYNYRMPNLNAALGCAQLEQLPKFLENKRRLAQKYKDAFSNIEGIHFFEEPSYAKSNYWLNTLILDPNFIHERNRILEETNKANIMTRPAWTLIHKMEIYKHVPRMDLTTAELLEQSIINIPSSACLGGHYE